MNEDKIFERVQKALSDVPLLLIGTGGTMPYGIPGMWELAEYLINKLDAKYKTDKEWITFTDRLRNEDDLEKALTDLHLEESIVDDIVLATWELVGSKDLKMLYQWLDNSYQPALGKLIHRLYQANPQCVNIITTNYDRVIEYACDQYELPVDNGFRGEYISRVSKSHKINRSKIINLLKVHGSLDWFFESNNKVVALPIQESVPTYLKPAIITPGTGKYRRVLESPFREVLHLADDLMAEAQNYLCIGYGFNDSQIQNNIIDGIKLGKPIVVVTKKITSEAEKLITSNSENYIIIQAYEKDENKTEFLLPQGKTIIDYAYWTQEGFLKII